MPRLLLVEPDPLLRSTLERLFANEGYACVIAAGPDETRRALIGERIDLVVLDVGQLRAEGLDLVRHIRTGYHVPLLILAPDDGVADIVAALEIGADDYLPEPFDPRELLARVRAQLRRAEVYGAPLEPAERIELGGITLDPDRRDAFRDGVPLLLTSREFDLLHLFARNPGRALASAWILERLWGHIAAPGVKALTVQVGRLRRKIETDWRHPLLLLTVRGFGYRLAGASE